MEKTYWEPKVVALAAFDRPAGGAFGDLLRRACNDFSSVARRIPSKESHGIPSYANVFLHFSEFGVECVYWPTSVAYKGDEKRRKKTTIFGAGLEAHGKDVSRTADNAYWKFSLYQIGLGTKHARVEWTDPERFFAECRRLVRLFEEQVYGPDADQIEWTEADH
jgi:hypothetical protein